MNIKRVFLLQLFCVVFALIFIAKIMGVFPPIRAFITQIVNPPFCKDCNVVLISLDTLSANHLPCYGYNRNTAPNLCKFGEENILFKNAFSNSSWTLPSHVSIFTGLLPSQHKMDGSGSYLPSTIAFLPEILQKNGYETHFYIPKSPTFFPLDSVYYRGINKIVLQLNPKLELGWDKGLKQLSTNNVVGKKTFLFLHTYWVHAPYILEGKNKHPFSVNDAKAGLPETPDQMKICTPSFMNYLKQTLEEDFEDGKLAKNTKLLAIYKKLYEQLTSAIKEKTEMQFCSKNNDSGLLAGYHEGYYATLAEKNDPESINHQRNLYDSRILELDEYLKDVFSYILNSDLKKNTIIIVTSDHGEEFMEHGSFGHTNLYDTDLKVPLMLYVPGQKNKEISQLAQSIDIFPTVLGLLKINTANYKLPGSDLLKNNIFGGATYSIAQHFDGISTIRDEEWKLFYYIKKNKPVGFRLFNYKKDPQEANNLIFTNNTVLERLLKKIKQITP